MTETENSKMPQPCGGMAVHMAPVLRRDFLLMSGAGMMSLAVPANSALAAGEPAPETSEPRIVDIAPLKEIAPGTQLSFNYPDPQSPAVLLRLQDTAKGGVGPSGTIVAFSILCTHKGCPVAFQRDRQMLICPCHWSSFDPGKGGAIVIGQASESLPQIHLQIKDDMVQAIGIEGLIYGRYTNIL